MPEGGGVSVHCNSEVQIEQVQVGAGLGRVRWGLPAIEQKQTDWQTHTTEIITFATPLAGGK